MTALPQRFPEDPFARDVLEGLSQHPKRLPSKYFYDAAGSALFEEICALPEYYPTRVEIGLLKTHVAEIADLAGRDSTLVEFGAGALKKVELLLDAVRPSVYVPIDISGEFLDRRAQALRQQWPGLIVSPVVADFTADFTWPGRAARNVGFFPGSTIGNMKPTEARTFLAGIRKHLSALLIGVDTVKDPTVLHAAYNDAAGVTAAFNRNLLVRSNRELGSDFDLNGFFHYAFYNPQQQRMEMHLVSRYRQEISILGERFVFREGESLHTENSYKYGIDDFRELAMAAGYIPQRVWLDENKMFSLHWLQAEPC